VTVVEQRNALVAELSAGSNCIHAWCPKARETLDSWVSAVRNRVANAISATEVRCTAAGCWLEVTVNEMSKWRDVMAMLPDVTLTRGWPGAMILGGPDYASKRGSVTVLWVLLPTVE
jgi:hypothetical protein